MLSTGLLVGPTSPVRHPPPNPGREARVRAVGRRWAAVPAAVVVNPAAILGPVLFTQGFIFLCRLFWHGLVPKGQALSWPRARLHLCPSLCDDMSPLEGKKEMWEHENMIFHAELFLNTLKQKDILECFHFHMWSWGSQIYPAMWIRGEGWAVRTSLQCVHACARVCVCSVCVREITHLLFCFLSDMLLAPPGPRLSRLTEAACRYMCPWELQRATV